MEEIHDRRLEYEHGNYERFEEFRDELFKSCLSLGHLFEAESSDEWMIQSLESQTVIARGWALDFIGEAENLFDPIPLPVAPFRNDCTQDLETVSPPDGVTDELREALEEAQDGLLSSCRVLGRGLIDRLLLRTLIGHPFALTEADEDQ